MLTSRSPRTVMRAAFALARESLPNHTSKFSRKDFTLRQLFACLVMREHQGLSYRGTEALLRDTPNWCRDIGMRRVPDHNTLCRAFRALNLARRNVRFLDRLTNWFAVARQLGTTVAIDSTLLETHHRSRHYERRCRHYASSASSDNHDNRTVNARRSATARRTPKLSFAVCTRSHVIVSVRAKLGMGSDCPDFEPLLFDAWRRHPRLRWALGDAGFDSEANHRVARDDMRVRSLIKTGIGRPTTRAPRGYYRRLMSKQLRGSQRGKRYGQRAQAETANSMVKRNFGDALRARTARGRRDELLLRAITHNLSLLCAELEQLEEGRD